MTENVSYSPCLTQKKRPQHRNEDSTVLHIAKTPPTENVINFPCAGNGKFPIFSAQQRMNGEKYSFTMFHPRLAATCSHLQPLERSPVAASGRHHSLLIGSIRQPLAPTCGQSSGRQWPPVFSSHRQPLAATCSQSSGRKWPPEQVAASGRQSKWPQVAASGCKWPPEQVAASGRQSKWPQVAASGRLCQNHIRALLHALCIILYCNIHYLSSMLSVVKGSSASKMFLINWAYDVCQCHGQF